MSIDGNKNPNIVLIEVQDELPIFENIIHPYYVPEWLTFLQDETDDYVNMFPSYLAERHKSGRQREYEKFRNRIKQGIYDPQLIIQYEGNYHSILQNIIIETIQKYVTNSFQVNTQTLEETKAKEIDLIFTQQLQQPLSKEENEKLTNNSQKVVFETIYKKLPDKNLIENVYNL